MFSYGQRNFVFGGYLVSELLGIFCLRKNPSILKVKLGGCTINKKDIIIAIEFKTDIVLLIVHTLQEIDNCSNEFKTIYSFSYGANIAVWQFQTFGSYISIWFDS